MTPILILELRGFSKLATDLSRELEILEVTPDRVRAAGIELVRQCVRTARDLATPTHEMHLGGDTWYWNFHDMSDAYRFAVSVLHLVKIKALEQGLFYLKPSVAIGLGEPRFDGPRFLDDDSISTYRVADGGKSFTLFAVGSAIAELASLGVELKRHDKFPDDDVKEAQWLGTPVHRSLEISTNVSLPKLLLDSEIIYSQSAPEALDNITRQQARSKSALVFGGPGSLDDPNFKAYVENTVTQLRGERDFSLTVLTYLPIDESISSYTWLELCRQLQIEMPKRFAFAAFPIPKGQLRPFSYHVYDGEIVHIGLRAYSTQRGTPTLSSAIMLKNSKIARRFEGELLENYRSVGQLTDETYAKLIRRFSSVSTADKGQAHKRINELLVRS